MKRKKARNLSKKSFRLLVSLSIAACLIPFAAIAQGDGNFLGTAPGQIGGDTRPPPPDNRPWVIGNKIYRADQRESIAGQFLGKDRGLVLADVRQYAVGASDYKTVAITNAPDYSSLADGARVRESAIHTGTVEINGRTLELWDCGHPYVLPPPTAEQLQAIQAAQAAKARAKFLTQSNSTFQLLQQATNGSPTDQYNLGMRYLQGYGCASNQTSAIYWFTRAADAGDKDAADKLKTLQP